MASTSQLLTISMRSAGPSLAFPTGILDFSAFLNDTICALLQSSQQKTQTRRIQTRDVDRAIEEILRDPLNVRLLISRFSLLRVKNVDISLISIQRYIGGCAGPFRLTVQTTEHGIYPPSTPSIFASSFVSTYDLGVTSLAPSP